MGSSLNVAVNKNAFILTDRATWLSFNNKRDHVVIVERDNNLFNYYGIIPINPEKCPNSKIELSEKFINWLLSDYGQELINSFEKNGEQLFFGNYKKMRKRLLLIFAYDRDGDCVAGSINFKKGNNLYGRYWGCKRDYKDLHFELCYYQQIEYAIKNTIANFEPRAEVISVNVGGNIDKNEIHVTLTFRVINVPEPVTIELFLERLR